MLSSSSSTGTLPSATIQKLDFDTIGELRLEVETEKLLEHLKTHRELKHQLLTIIWKTINMFALIQSIWAFSKEKTDQSNIQQVVWD